MRLSGIVVFILIISLVMSLIPVSAGAESAAALIPKAYIDFSSRARFEENSEVYKHTPSESEPDPNTVGVFSFSDTEKALKLEYAPTNGKAPWRIIFRTEAARADYPFAVIVYKAKCKSDARISLWNSPKQGIEAVFCEAAGDTGGKWAVSEPVRIDTSKSPNIMSRMTSQAPSNLYIDCADESAEFYIKELTFFRTAEDARLYYSLRDPETSVSGDKVGAEVLPDPIAAKTESGELCFDGLNYSADFKVDSALTAYMPQVRISYRSNETAAHELILEVHGESVTVCGDISASGGKEVRTSPVFIPEYILTAIASGDEFTVRSTATRDGSFTEITELMFFATEEQAFSHYGDKRTVSEGGRTVKFGPFGNAAFYGNGSTDTYGRWSYDAATDSLAVTFCKSALREEDYVAMVKLQYASKWQEGDRFVRIVYEAQGNGEDAYIRLINNKTGAYADLGTAVYGSGFRLSSVGELDGTHIERFRTGQHCTVSFGANAEGNTYRIRSVHFFATREDAELYTIDSGSTPITVGDSPIGGYRIVIPADADENIKNAADIIASAVYKKCGVRLETVTDSEPATDKEIIIGICDREECRIDDGSRVRAYTENGKVVIVGIFSTEVADLTGDWARIFLENGKRSTGGIVIDGTSSLEMPSYLEFVRPTYEKADHEALNYSFDSASELGDFDGDVSFTGQSMRFEGEVRSRIYEADSRIGWAFSYSDAEDDGRFGVRLRDNLGQSYVSAVIDLGAGTLSLNLKPTLNTEEITLAKCGIDLLADHLYVMDISVVGEAASVSLGGRVILETNGVFMTTPGKTAFFADGAALDVYELDVTLLTEVGRFTDDGVFGETVLMSLGGSSNYRIPSIITTNDGTLIAAANDRRNTLADRADVQWVVIRRKEIGGEWEELRVLASGEDAAYSIGNLIYDDVRDVIYLTYNGSTSNSNVAEYWGGASKTMAAVSRDDGVTWEITETTVLPNEYGLTGHTHGASAGFVLKYGEHAGRIISPARTAYDYSEGQTTLQTKHFNCTFYSDDGGLTWQTGGMVQPGTGEGTLIERSDGTILFNSRAYFQDHYRRTAYSYDGGETFGDFGVETALREPMNGVNASMLRAELANGQTVTLFSNPYVEGDMVGTGTRKNMTVCISYDEGRTWVAKKTVHEAFSAYSCLTYNHVTDTFFLLYESGEKVENQYQHISVIEFDLDWLLS